MLRIFFLFLTGFSIQLAAQDSLSVGVATNIRALAVVDSLHWWFGGSGGYLGHTTNGGKSWKLRQPAGNQVDFRSLHAFNNQEAVAAIAGQPAQIFRTKDDGTHWEMVHQLNDTTAFMDAIGFWNAQEGLIFGDPLPDGRLLLLVTKDSGHSWTPMADSSRPLLAKGEAAFAASGTAMQCLDDSTVVIVTGGLRTRLLLSINRGRTWEVLPADRWQPKTDLLPYEQQPERLVMAHGSASKGAFSVARTPDSIWVLAGGDYLIDSSREHNMLVRAGDNWWSPRHGPRGYRECILVLSETLWVVTGPTGSDISWNGGLDWYPLNDLRGMHVVKPLGQGVLLAGRGGRLWRYQQLPAASVLSSNGVAESAANLEKQIKKTVRKHRK